MLRAFATVGQAPQHHESHLDMLRIRVKIEAGEVNPTEEILGEIPSDVKDKMVRVEIELRICWRTTRIASRILVDFSAGHSVNSYQSSSGQSRIPSIRVWLRRISCPFLSMGGSSCKGQTGLTEHFLKRAARRYYRGMDA